MVCKACGAYISDNDSVCSVCGTIVSLAGTTVLSIRTNPYVRQTTSEIELNQAQDKTEIVQNKISEPDQNHFFRAKKEYREAKRKKQIQKKRMRLLLLGGPAMLLAIGIAVLVLNISIKKIDYNEINEQIYNCDDGKTNLFYAQDCVCYYDVETNSILSYHAKTLRSIGAKYKKAQAAAIDRSLTLPGR